MIFLLAVLCGAGLVVAQAAGALCMGSCTTSTTDWQLSSLTAYTNTLLASGQVVWAGTNDGVWSTNDAGTRWKRAGLPGQTILSLSQSQASSVLAAGTENGDVFLRAGTQSWGSTHLRLGSNYPIYSLAVSPDGRTILAGSTGVLYRGHRVSAAWSWHRVVQNNQFSFTSILWAPWNSRTVFTSAFSYHPPVLESRDAGLTWQPFSTGLPNAVPSQALLPLPNRQLIFTTMGGGVWQWTGARWHDISAGLPERHAMPLVRVPGKPGAVYTGTMGFGVFARAGTGAWRRIGSGLQNGDHTVLGIAYVDNQHPTLLAATALGVYRYALPGTGR